MFSPQFKRSIVVSSDSDLWLLSSILSRLTATSITVNNNCGNSASFTSLDFTPFSLLRQITIGDNCFGNVRKVKLSGLSKLESVVIGDDCFMYVSELKMIGLSELEKVEIGEYSFTQHKNSWSNDPNRHFCVKNCPKLKSLKMGRYSFSDYGVIEIENVNALESIEMGDLSEVSYNFYYASLELRSILIHCE